jgi:hypothetical protein
MTPESGALFGGSLRSSNHWLILQYGRDSGSLFNAGQTNGSHEARSVSQYKKRGKKRDVKKMKDFIHGRTTQLRHP